MAHAAGLYYELHGPEGAPPLILSPGLGGSGDYWRPNLPPLAARHRVILYDHRGTARSDRALDGPVTVEAWAQDVIALMDALGMERASLIGHAAGGLIGLALALLAPERLDRLVVVNGWAKADPHFLRCFDARLALLRGSGPETYLRAQPIFLYPADWISAHSATLDAELPHQLAAFPAIETVENCIAALAAFDIADRLGEIPHPVLVLSTADDMLVPSGAGQRLADGLPNAVFARAPWGGHAVNITDPDHFTGLTLEWLAGKLS